MRPGAEREVYMSSKAAKMKKHGVVRVCACPTLEWHNFTLQLNDMFGEDEKGYYVSRGRPGTHKGTVIVYRCTRSASPYKEFDWYKTVEFISHGTGKAIEAKARTLKPQKLKPCHVDRMIREQYNPSLTTEPFDATAAGRRRIPSAGFGPQTVGQVKPDWLKRNPKYKDNSPAAWYRQEFLPVVVK